jgi:hypothetical protein
VVVIIQVLGGQLSKESIEVIKKILSKNGGNEGLSLGQVLTILGLGLTAAALVILAPVLLALVYAAGIGLVYTIVKAIVLLITIDIAVSLGIAIGAALGAIGTIIGNWYKKNVCGDQSVVSLTAGLEGNMFVGALTGGAGGGVAGILSRALKYVPTTAMNEVMGIFGKTLTNPATSNTLAVGGTAMTTGAVFCGR